MQQQSEAGINIVYSKEAGTNILRHSMLVFSFHAVMVLDAGIFSK